MGTCITIVETN